MHLEVRSTGIVCIWYFPYISLKVLLKRGPHQPYFVAKKMDKKLMALIVVHVDVGDGAWVCQSNCPVI